MLRRKLVTILAPLALLACAESAVAATTLVMTKNAACGCCDGWVEHMRKAGFKVEVKVVDDVTPTAERLGIPDKLRSCHTTEAGDYAIEGHVPATDVERLLATRPNATGLAVPGMVAGSPGMEGGRAERYDVILFGKGGKTEVFASH